MLKKRSDKKELLDADDIPDKDIYQNLKELDVINALLGGYRITFSALRKVLKKNKEYILVDIGSGGGDTLKRIHKWSQAEKIKLNLFGIDLKQTCIDYSVGVNPNSAIKFICDDYKNLYQHLPKVDIIHASLFCHHLTDKEIIELIQFSQINQSILIINDLERNAFAHYAIKLLTYFFSKSYLIKNDAPLSVLRGFKIKEWKKIIQQSGAKNFTINYKWAF
jgi:2-polyprenyl-3-methyl-5-hydroxy-6-metoxy-1,4-benzoquinol methylase